MKFGLIVGITIGYLYLLMCVGVGLTWPIWIWLLYNQQG